MSFNSPRSHDSRRLGHSAGLFFILASYQHEFLIYFAPPWHVLPSLVLEAIFSHHLHSTFIWIKGIRVSSSVPVSNILTSPHAKLFCIIEAYTKWPLFSRWHFRMHFLKENVWIPIKISLKFVPKSPINNIPALVPLMAWRRPGDKPLSEPMLVRLPRHISVTRPQWVFLMAHNGTHFADKIINHIFSTKNWCISIQISLNIVLWV